jgi:hypothetical protein
VKRHKNYNGDLTNWFILKEVGERGDETDRAVSPFEDESFSGLLDLMEMYKAEYPMFTDFRVYHNVDYHGYGARTYWYDLQGYTSNPSSIELLYGVS